MSDNLPKSNPAKRGSFKGVYNKLAADLPYRKFKSVADIAPSMKDSAGCIQVMKDTVADTTIEVKDRDKKAAYLKKRYPEAGK